METAAVVVTYNPPEGTINLLKSLLLEGIYLIVIDNGSEPTTTQQFQEFSNNQSFYWEKLDKNFGLAYGQNHGIRFAKALGVKWIFCFDQDSNIPPNYTQKMLDVYQQYNDSPPIGILAPNYYDPNTGSQARFAKLGKIFYSHHTCQDCSGLIEVSLVISSGSLIPMSVFNEIGLFEESFFIDGIDIEFCLRALSKGYAVFVNCNCIIEHTIGNTSLEKLFGWITLKPNHHPALRKYYAARNWRILLLKYGHKFISFSLLHIARLINMILCIAFYENDKLNKFGAIFRGLLMKPQID